MERPGRSTPTVPGLTRHWSNLPDSALWPTRSGRRPGRPTQTIRGNLPIPKQTMTLSSGEENAGDNLSPEASPGKRNRLLLRRLTLNSPRVLYWTWNTRKRKQRIDALKFDVELDVIATPEVNNGEKILPYSSLGCYQQAVYGGRTVITSTSDTGPRRGLEGRGWTVAR